MSDPVQIPKRPTAVQIIKKPVALTISVAGARGIPGSSATDALDALWDVKGDIAVATGPDAAVRLGVGEDGSVLTADSAEAVGVKWAAPVAAGLSENQVNALIAAQIALLPSRTLKPSDESRASTNVVAADTHLKFTMEANAKYAFRLLALFDAPITASFKYRWYGPASPALIRSQRKHVVSGGTAYAFVAVDQAYSTADSVCVSAGNLGGSVELQGVIHNGVNAGDFEFHWSQNSSNPSPCVVRAGSFVEWKAV